MNAETQSGIHPNSEQLAAFAERALSEQERGDVLAHLAVCARCRQITALAQEAAAMDEVTVADTEKRRTAVQPDAWWKRWRLVWVPAAVAAAFAVTSISVFLRQAGHRDTSITIAQQSNPPEIHPASVLSPPEPAKAAPPPHPAPASHSAVKKAPAELPESLPRTTEPGPVVAAEPPAPEVMNGPITARDESGKAASGEAHGSVGESFSAHGSAAGFRTPTATAVYHAEQQKAAQAGDRRLLAARAKAPPSAAALADTGEHAPESGAAVDGDQIVVSDQLQAQAAPAPGATGLLKLKSGDFAPGPLGTMIHLPGKLPPISIASAGQTMLAIDRSGSVFLSEDSGATWKPVSKQWTGRAVIVRRSAAGGSQLEAERTARADSTGGGSGAGAASESSVVFELLNDQGQVWSSTDGTAWTAK
jgi:hypothetical protein